MSTYLNDMATESAKDITRAINAMAINNNEVGELIAHDHRTLQQSFMGVVIGFINEMANNEATGAYDLRNEAACKAAAAMKEAWGDYPPPMPFI